ncbi:Mannosyltransferase [Aphelenchoides besseyi]|nr:Mannosyltransferase [Aphelenchoides besseyi]
MGAGPSIGRNNDELITCLIDGNYIRHRSIEWALRMVDRGQYFPEDNREDAYKDLAYKSNVGDPGHIHLSAPCIYANALEFLNLQPKQSFLNIGSGTGYFNTVVGYLLGELGTNHGVEIYDNLIDYAREKLTEALRQPEFSAYSFCIPEFFNGSAFFLRPSIKYDRIYCGALIPMNRRAYFSNMLKIGGILVMPYGSRLLQIVRTSQTEFTVYRISTVTFSELVAPNPEIERTTRECILPANQPMSLSAVCRREIRSKVRSSVLAKKPLPTLFEFQRDQPEEESAPTTDHMETFVFINVNPAEEEPSTTPVPPAIGLAAHDSTTQSTFTMTQTSPEVDSIDLSQLIPGYVELRPEASSSKTEQSSSTSTKAHQSAANRNTRNEIDIAEAARTTAEFTTRLLTLRRMNARETATNETEHRGRNETEDRPPNERPNAQIRLSLLRILQTVSENHRNHTTNSAPGSAGDSTSTENSPGTSGIGIAQRNGVKRGLPDSSDATENKLQKRSAQQSTNEELLNLSTPMLSVYNRTDETTSNEESVSPTSASSYVSTSSINSSTSRSNISDASTNTTSSESSDQRSNRRTSASMRWITSPRRANLDHSTDTSENGEDFDDSMDTTTEDPQREERNTRALSYHQAMNEFDEEFKRRLAELPLSNRLVRFLVYNEFDDLNCEMTKRPNWRESFFIRLDWLENPRFGFLLVYRILNLFLVRTWFVPDEQFQSVEVAYARVFGVGHLSWEWKDEFAIRSYLHPLLFMIFYYPLKLFNLDGGLLIRILPNLIHCFLFAINDVFVGKLMHRLFEKRDQTVARAAYLLYLSNWFVWFCAPRTLSNSLETVLTIIGLHFYPLDSTRSNVFERKNTGYPFVGYSICAALACLIRPTAALIWGPLAAVHLWRAKKHQTRLLIQHLLPPAIVVAVLSIAIDSWSYGRFTIPAWNFIEFNVLSGGSANFGVNPWYWFLSEGIPPVFTISVIPLVLAIWELFFMNGQPPSKQRRQFANSNLLLIIAISYIFLHSFIAHKEHRFLLPIIPLMLPHVASYILRLDRLNNLTLWLIVIVQIPIALYFGLQHQKAPGEMIDYLNEQLKSRALGPATVAQLMPCYSMPQYSAIHPYGVLGTKIIALDCSPNLNQTLLPGRTRDESELFHFDPLNFVRTHWTKIGQSNFIFAYERVFKKLEPFLRSQGYEVAQRFYNTRFPVGSNQDPWVYALTRHTEV